MTISATRRFRFVITVVSRSSSCADLACRVFQCHPGTTAIERLGHGGLNWIVCTAEELEDAGLPLDPQINAMIWQIQPVTAGLTAAHVIQAANYQSCREIDEHGEPISGELPVM